MLACIMRAGRDVFTHGRAPIGLQLQTTGHIKEALGFSQPYG